MSSGLGDSASDLTQQRAAAELKLRSVRSVKHYEAATQSISPRIAMLCEAVERTWWRGKHKSKGADDFHDPRDIVATPQTFFDRLDAEFHSTVDVAALPENANRRLCCDGFSLERALNC